MAGVGALHEEALKRKERLRTLRRKQNDFTDLEEPLSKKKATEGEEKLPKPVFRSYNPQDDSLKDGKLPDTKPAEVTDYVKDQLSAAKPEPLVEEVDLINLAPRKPDWDLKRDVAKKLEKLERRTQRAIAELIRERLKVGETDLVAAVSASNVPEEEED